MISVTAAIIENNGKLLIAQRKKGDPLEYKWELPGGKIEPNETPEDCLTRELKEEFNIITQIIEYFDTSKFTYNHIDIELIAYKVKHLSGEIFPTSHEAIKWVKPENLFEYDFAEADKPLIYKYLKEKQVIPSINNNRDNIKQ